MKNYIVLGAAMCIALGMTSCKSSESAYKKAYEKARAQQAQVVTPAAEQVQTVVTQPQQVTPVQTVTTAPVVSNANTRSENLTVVSGSGLRAYSVVVGAFSIKANAENLQQKLLNAGYQAQIAINPDRGLYRVIASTFDDLGSAVQSRDGLRSTYPDAWLLRK